MNESRNHSYVFTDFVDAWRGARRWENAHADIAGYHGDRYRAFSKAFGVDLNEPPDPGPPIPDWLVTNPHAGNLREMGREQSNWRLHIYPFILNCEELAGRINGPWDGMLETPPTMSNI